MVKNMLEIYLYHEGELPPDNDFTLFRSSFAPVVGDFIHIPNRPGQRSYEVKTRTIFVRALQNEDEITVYCGVMPVDDRQVTSNPKPIDQDD